MVLSRITQYFTITNHRLLFHHSLLLSHDYTLSSSCSSQDCSCDRSRGFFPSRPASRHCKKQQPPSGSCPAGTRRDRCGSCRGRRGGRDRCADCNGIPNGGSKVGKLKILFYFTSLSYLEFPCLFFHLSEISLCPCRFYISVFSLGNLFLFKLIFGNLSGSNLN